jgi:6-pyruvoyltetrahydropterin/6-carboxytetrahydropterin synthase
METFKEFTFEAAHRSPPFEGLHGHSFKVQVFMRGERDPVYGWSHNLYEVDQVLSAVRQQLDHKFLNDIEGLPYATLENVAHWIRDQLRSKLPGLSQVVLTRGRDGQVEGCIVPVHVCEPSRAAG